MVCVLQKVGNLSNSPVLCTANARWVGGCPKPVTQFLVTGRSLILWLGGSLKSQICNTCKDNKAPKEKSCGDPHPPCASTVKGRENDGQMGIPCIDKAMLAPATGKFGFGTHCWGAVASAILLSAATPLHSPCFPIELAHMSSRFPDHRKTVRCSRVLSHNVMGSPASDPHQQICTKILSFNCHIGVQPKRLPGCGGRAFNWGGGGQYSPLEKRPN